MDNTYIARQNVARFRNELENGAAGARRVTIRRLLIAEENLLGLTREQFDEMSRQIARIKLIIAKQTETVAMLKSNGHSVERAEGTLADLNDLLVAHEEHRQKIAAAL